MIILAADTSTPVLTVAVCRGHEPLAETAVACGRAHAERLHNTALWVLDQAGVPLESVDALAITRGPGSFTGLRIGIAAWKGLALARSLPLAGVSTLEALAFALPAAESVCAVLDAKMGEVFAAVFRRTPTHALERVGAERACTAGDLALSVPPGTWFVGDGAVRYRHTLAAVPGAEFASLALHAPRASLVAACAIPHLESGSGDPAAVMPVYLRPSQAERLRTERAVP